MLYSIFESCYENLKLPISRKKNCNYMWWWMLTRLNVVITSQYIHTSNHCYIPESNKMLYANYSPVKKGKKERKMAYKLSNLTASLGFHFFSVKLLGIWVINLFCWSDICQCNLQSPVTKPMETEEKDFSSLLHSAQVTSGRHQNIYQPFTGYFRYH